MAERLPPPRRGICTVHAELVARITLSLTRAAYDDLLVWCGEQGWDLSWDANDTPSGHMTAVATCEEWQAKRIVGWLLGSPAA